MELNVEGMTVRPNDSKSDVSRRFYFGQKVHCWWYNSWLFKPPKPCTIICKLPYKGSYYPHPKSFKEPFYLVKIYKAGFAAIPEGCIQDLKEKVEEEDKHWEPRPSDDEEQGRAWDTLKEWHDIDVRFLNGR